MEVEAVCRDDPYDEISDFLANGVYPQDVRGDAGKKSNFRRKAHKYVIRDGILYFKHKAHRYQSNGKLKRTLNYWYILYYWFLRISLQFLRYFYVFCIYLKL